MNKNPACLFAVSLLLFSSCLGAEVPTRLPVGMNLDQLSYWSPSLPFSDVMTTASDLLTTNLADSPWDSGRISEIELTPQGLPSYLPQRTSDGKLTHVRFLVNNFYKGKYQISFEGDGTLGGAARKEGAGYVLTLNGTGENTWIDILTSQKGNPLRNLRILPDGVAQVPVFQHAYLQGLKPFHALRFMDWTKTNGSTQVHWKDRVTKDFYTQAGPQGSSWDYAIDLCNELDTDAWVCVPHQASDDYIRQLARLWRDRLEPGRKIYLEYSNEVWNWAFPQAQYVLNNAPGAVDASVSRDLAQINPEPKDHPEKDAYMMARVFRLWRQEFGAQAASRVVNVATSQHAWPDNSRRILEYLFRSDSVKPQALAVGGYFGYSEEDHMRWLKSAKTLTPESILKDTLAGMGLSDQWTADSATVARRFGVSYLVYEGGQHMQPWNQGEHPTNPILWAAQIHPNMGELYRHNFQTHRTAGTQLFMAFNYIGSRESRWGSWGHLESLDQVGSDYRKTAPKYQALLEANSLR